MPIAKPSQIADVPGHVCSSDELCAVVEPRMATVQGNRPLPAKGEKE